MEIYIKINIKYKLTYIYILYLKLFLLNLRV